MRKTASILIVIILLIVTGCSNKEVIKHNYTYKGENELWTVEYKVNGTVTFTEKNGKTECESNSNKILTVNYKKDLSELSSVKHLEISYESSAGGGKSNLDFNDNPPNEKTYTLKSGGTGAIENKDEIIKVNITIDGKAQTIELKNVQ
ncbi:hypothetical protein KDK92_16730 [Oceanirhabdus seepicola]|uniref:Uncharacterized protein n=1 Tax=Oceanirhabdus seepicola TaxID=2828781 RepID=A0A9J6P6G0_9CLOT|nr:hypothetical protein [Oceanirhabdus seepicola]MCM1991381.1 hypothetical protein [Oceanirhabdus seepicola]